MLKGVCVALSQLSVVVVVVVVFVCFVFGGRFLKNVKNLLCLIIES